VSSSSLPGEGSDEALRPLGAADAAVLREGAVIRYGDLFGLRAARITGKGFNDETERIRFSNVWLEK
jgi:hypothetical protein